MDDLLLFTISSQSIENSLETRPTSDAAVHISIASPPPTRPAFGSKIGRVLTLRRYTLQQSCIRSTLRYRFQTIHPPAICNSHHSTLARKHIPCICTQSSQASTLQRMGTDADATGPGTYPRASRTIGVSNPYGLYRTPTTNSQHQNADPLKTRSRLHASPHACQRTLNKPRAFPTLLATAARARS